MAYLRYTRVKKHEELNRASIVFATPPSSYIGLQNVIELAIAQAGNMKLLTLFTSLEDELKNPRDLLSEQLETLQYALTRPSVQVLLYEAHSILTTETSEMINQVVVRTNRMTREKYKRDHKVALM